MGDKPSKEEIKAARARVREHNRDMAQLASVAARNGHSGMAHNLANTMLLSRLDADMLRARAAHAG